MRVSISVGGKFCSFHLGHYLAKAGYLEQFITAYPKFIVAREGIPREKISPVLSVGVLERAWKYAPRLLHDRYNPQYALHSLFDLRAKSRLRECDILIAWGNYCSLTLPKAKKMGAVTGIVISNSHIRYQRRLLEEEYRRFSIPMPQMNPHIKMIPKAEREYEETDYIFVNSLFVKKSFIEEGVPESKLIHIVEGVDVSIFRQVPKKDTVFRIIFVGGLCLRKGTHYLLRAFSELKLPNAELVLVGTVNDEIKPFLQKYRSSAIQIMGHVPKAELYRYYSQGSVFVMPSIEEGLAQVQFQAMACGLPLISTTNSGAEDIIREEKDGFIVPIRDVDALKEKIVYFYEHPEKAVEMGQSAKRHISDGFSWDNYGKNMVAAMDWIHARKRR